MINPIRGQTEKFPDFDKILVCSIIEAWRLQWQQFFFNFNTTPIIRLLIKIISDIMANCNYLSDFIEILYSSQLKECEYNGDNYFSKFLCHAFN